MIIRLLALGTFCLEPISTGRASPKEGFHRHNRTCGFVNVFYIRILDLGCQKRRTPTGFQTVVGEPIFISTRMENSSR